MTQYVNVPLSEKSYRRIKQWAELRQQDVGEAIADYLADVPLPAEENVVPPSKPAPQVEQEKSAYLQLYPQLKRSHSGQYVAIYQGQLVDHDEDYGALFARIDDQYPDEFVWLTRVGDEPIDTIRFRSPRLERA
jgi:hypothetical protein